MGKLVENVVDLLDAIDVFVNLHGFATWQEAKRAVEDKARELELDGSLEEFVGWFAE